MAGGKVGLAVTLIPPGNILSVKSTKSRPWSIKLGGVDGFFVLFLKISKHKMW